MIYEWKILSQTRVIFPRFTRAASDHGATLFMRYQNIFGQLIYSTQTDSDRIER